MHVWAVLVFVPYALRQCVGRIERTVPRKEIKGGEREKTERANESGLAFLPLFCT